MPARIPSSLASLLAVAFASSSFTCTTSSIRSTLSTSGTNPAPIPWILCGPGLPPESTGEPVGSENLSRALHRALSPATLRNLMADLEALGYLDHPHTSAGRVPTDDGYRVYVDALMGPHPLPPGEAAKLAMRAREEAGKTKTPGARRQVVLWRLDDAGVPRAEAFGAGNSSASYVEILSGSLKEGAKVITGYETAEQAAAREREGPPPGAMLMGAPPPPPPPPPGGGGGPPPR